MNESRYVGCIIGLAVGVALGYPAEFRTREQILREIGPDGISDFIALKDPRFSRPFFFGADQPPGTYTDDTQMTIAVAEALLAAGGGDLDPLMHEMALRFVEWSRSHKNNRAPGGTCTEGCENLASRGPSSAPDTESRASLTTGEPAWRTPSTCTIWESGFGAQPNGS